MPSNILFFNHGLSLSRRLNIITIVLIVSYTYVMCFLNSLLFFYHLPPQSIHKKKRATFILYAYFYCPAQSCPLTWYCYLILHISNLYFPRPHLSLYYHFLIIYFYGNHYVLLKEKCYWAISQQCYKCGITSCIVSVGMLRRYGCDSPP